MKFGLAALVDVPMSRLAARARLVEQLGFDQLWIPDERLLRNVYVSLATAASHTERIALGTAVTNPYTRNPAVTAAAIATIDELSGGRTVLGLGAGGGLDAYGIDRDHPAARLEETVDIVRALTRGGTTSYHGRWFELTDTHLDFLPLRQIPVHLAARGPKILELAGRIADGVIIGGFAQPGGLAWAKQAVARGLTTAGRSWADIETTAWTFVSVSEDRTAAREAVSRMVLAAMISSRPILDDIGVALPPELRDRLDAEGWTMGSDLSHMATMLTDEIVDAFAVHGTAEDCIGRLAAIRDAEVDQVGFVVLPPAGDSVEDVAIRLAESVMPAFGGPEA